MAKEKPQPRERKKPKPLPKIWEGGTTFLLGGGPTLNDVDFSTIKNRKIIGINNAFGDPSTDRQGKYFPRDWVNICWFGDARWFDWHMLNLKEYKGFLATCANRFLGHSRIFNYARGKPFGIEEDPNSISWNKNSGSSCINFAYHIGVKRIVLLGFDMKRVDDKANWHSDHPVLTSNPYNKYLKTFKNISLDADRLCLEIINATPGSAIPYFPIMTLEECLIWEKKNPLNL